MIVVLDANILVSASIARAGSTLAAIIDTWQRNTFEVVISEHIFTEVQRALGEPFFRRRLPPQDIADFLLLIRTTASFVRVTAVVQGVATHPADDLVLATALSARADYLVTGDVRFRSRVPHFQGIPLISPAELLALLRTAADEP